MKTRSIRQKEIAEKTGFSINTVSLALKGSPRIREETRAKILDCAEKLNYIPNVIARSLVQKKTNTIGIILTELLNPILTETAQQIEHHLKKAGYNMILMITDNNPEHEAEALDVLVSRQVDGILMYPVLTQNHLKIQALREKNFPVILLAGGDYPLPTNAVYVDRKIGAYKAVSHFLSLGHKRIGFINGAMAGNEEKLKGYLDALRDHRVDYDPDLVHSVEGYGFEVGYFAAQHLLKCIQPPTAILCSRDYLALGFILWCRRQGLRVPEDLSIIGFDDIPAARYADTPLTSVRYDVKAVTQRATEMLLNQIENQDPILAAPIQKIAIEPDLVIRQSCSSI